MTIEELPNGEAWEETDGEATSQRSNDAKKQRGGTGGNGREWERPAGNGGGARGAEMTQDAGNGKVMAESAVQSKRIWLVVGGVFLAVWCLGLAFLLPGPPRDVADYSWRLVDLDDKPVEFSRFKGKPVFLNVWATWCGPCVAEMPTIAAAARDPRLKDLAFVCVSVDAETAKVRSFVRDKGWDRLTFLRADDAPEVFSLGGFPATFLIAPDGQIKMSQAGALHWDSKEQIAQLQAFLEKSGAAKP
jgi:thiol-disulfide isomerase/thioredoxin